jgi:glycerol-3-phosphate acyltransferase PlsY
MIYYIICAVVGYLIGSIPFGYILVKLIKGIDIRTVGSGNIGATNVGRVLGWPFGIIVFLLDAAKGLFPTLYVMLNLSLSPQVMFKLPQSNPNVFSAVYFPDAGSAISIGLGIILGHLFPIYIRFKGGKGVATALGVFLVLTHFQILPVFIIWLIVFIVFRYVSVASIIAVISLPITFWWKAQYEYPRIWETHFTIPVMIACILATVFVIIRHIPNIKRLIKGTEPKVNFRKKPQITQINTYENK